MSTMITVECINCGACEPECPNQAISQGEDIFVIDPALCTECVGFHDQEACAAVCPVDCCIPDADNVEAEADLLARAAKLHPDKQFPAPGWMRCGSGMAATPPGGRRSSRQRRRSAIAMQSASPAPLARGLPRSPSPT